MRKCWHGPFMSSSKMLCVGQRGDSRERAFWWRCRCVLIRLLLFGFALGYRSYILSETQFNIKNMSQSSEHIGKVTVGDGTYLALSKERGTGDICWSCYPNNDMNISNIPYTQQSLSKQSTNWWNMVEWFYINKSVRGRLNSPIRNSWVVKVTE